jgi:phage tail-like protein
MDVNRTPFWLAAERDDFALRDGVAWSEGSLGVMLAPADEPLLPARDRNFALAAHAAARPRAFDPFAQLAFLSADRRELWCDFGSAASAATTIEQVLDEEMVPLIAPLGHFVDFAVGGGSLLALAWHDAASATAGLITFDLRRRTVERCALPGVPRRLFVAPDRRVFVATEAELLIAAGESLPQPYLPRPARFEPTSITPRPLQVTGRTPLPPLRNVLAATHDATRLFLLCHDDDFDQLVLARRLDAGPDEAFTSHRLPGSPHPFVIDAAALERSQLALLAPRRPEEADQRRDAWVVTVPDAKNQPVQTVRRRWPMRELADARFVAGFDGRVRYPATLDAASGRVRPAGVRELVALPLPRRVARGTVAIEQPFDSGRNGCIWHRLYLDACVPEGSELVVRAATSDLPTRPPDHHFVVQPRPAWNSRASELPFADSIAPQERDRSGLFELLLQRDRGRVRRLEGRWLWLEVELRGDGRASPTLHALRAVGPRFSWQEHYLPELFRQEEAVEPLPAEPPAEGAPPSAIVEPNGADFRERWLANLEGIVTPIEGQIAAAELLLDPQSAPAPHLPFLARFVGVELDLSWPAERQRRAVAVTGEIARRRGTLPAVRLALDVATDGLVARGAIVVVENFRLRRVMATLLGIDLDDHDHPLTLGTMESGNSIVGDSLILSEQTAREFLALYDPAALKADEAKAVESFLERHAHKVTVLLHGPARERQVAVERVLEREMPAHLQWELFATDRPFVPGLAPLLAVDTWIERTPPPRGVVLDDTYMTREGVLIDAAAFAPAAANAHPSRRRPREDS